MPRSLSVMKRSKEATIFDVAAKAGVAISTVSLALHRSNRVSPATRQAVLKAAKALHYQPNLGAQSLARRQTNLIAVCGWFGRENLDASSAASNHLLMGILDRLKGTRYAIYLVNWSTHPDEHRRLIRDFSDQKFVCGSIWLSSSLEPVDRKQLRSSNFPVALAEASMKGVDSVVVDSVQGGYLGAQHLLQKTRKLAVIVADPKGLVQMERLSGVQKAAREAGVPWNGVTVFTALRYSFNDGLALSSKLASLAKKAGPLGIFCLAGDKAALGLMHGLKKLGIAIPGQVSVIGWDGLLEGSYFTPALTTVEQPLHELGYKSADALIHRLENPKAAVQLVQLQPKLVIRESA